MTAYVIVDVEVIDMEGYQAYARLARPTVEQYGGKYLARGGQNELLEGDWQPKRLVILEFESLAQAKTWLNSPEYAPVRAMRHKYGCTNMVVVEGV
ncbi:MAG: DUF1330 domain-containing protein [Anaerolineales bacterium]|nr:DUF1330 domain-containing protein [Anaerolineales bacterium]